MFNRVIWRYQLTSSLKSDLPHENIYILIRDICRLQNILTYCVFSSPLQIFQAALQEDDEYVYDEVDVEKLEKKKSTGGSRLVGARLGKMKEEVPFIVAINSHGSSKTSSCTGSLITPSWVLTAAHCVEYIPQVQSVQNKIRKICKYTYIFSSRSRYWLPIS